MSFTGSAQSALEQLAKQQISEKTGIDPNLIATLFVTEQQDQFVLAFVYINQSVLQSKLKPELKSAIASFVDKKAMLTMVVPTQRSFFSPLKISFQQGGLSYLIDANSVHPVTEGFGAGLFDANTVNSGIILLPSAIDVGQPFQITYDGQFSTTFSISGTPSPPPQSGSPLPPGGFLFLLFQFILLVFLLPFLI
jgi:hypothetical protein